MPKRRDGFSVKALIPVLVIMGSITFMALLIVSLLREDGAITAPVAALLIVGSIIAVAISLASARRPPSEYGPEEIARNPADPTVITIARAGLVTYFFYEDGERVASAETSGNGGRGIVLRLENDQREMLVTTVGSWAEQTNFDLKPGVQLQLVVDGEPRVTALSPQPPPLREGLPQAEGTVPSFEIETAQGLFTLAYRDYGKYAVLRGDSVVGIAAMPLPQAPGGRWTTRIELPGSLPLETRIFIALVGLVHDRNRNWK